LAHGQLVPPDTAYEWSDDAGTADATDAANWHSPDGTQTLPPEDAHLFFGNRPAAGNLYYGATLTDFGDAPMPSRFASLWFGFGELDNYLVYTLTGSAITVGYGTTENDRLIVANGRGFYIFDLDVLIHDVPGLAFRIHNDMPSEWDELNFAQTLTSNGTLIVSGYGRTLINELHGTGELIKKGAGLLRVDAASYTGAVTVRGGALVSALNDDSALTLAGGVYGLANGPSTFERDLGAGSGKVRWLAGQSGGFAAHDGAELHVTLDGGRTLTWGETDFVSIGSELLFGSATAGGSVYWHNALDLGDPLDSSTHTIRLNRYAVDLYNYANFELHLSEELIAATGQKLRFIGSGTVVISADNNSFFGTLEIAGVELSLRDGGRFGEVAHFTVRDGGTLAVSIPQSGLSPLSSTAAITLSSGTLRWDDPYPAGVTRTLGDIILGGGANRIERTSLTNVLRANSLVRNDSRSTLLVALLANASPGSSLLEFNDTSALQNSEIGGIHPWLVTMTGPNEWSSRADWGIFDINGHLRPYLNYYEGSEDTWDAGYNVNVPGSGTPLALSDDRTINSLRLTNKDILLQGNTLTISSGGLLVNSNGFGVIHDAGNGSTFGAITTSGGRPLYIHAHSDLLLSAQITGGIDLVKAGVGNLNLGSGNAKVGHVNELGSLYIHQGELHLDGDARISTTGTIYVGDGGSYAALVLRNERGAPLLSGKRDVRLRGSHDYSKTAELRLFGAHDLRLNHFSIEGNSVLAFQLPLDKIYISKIYSELFTFETASGQLLVHSWIQQEITKDTFIAWSTHILVRKTSPGLDGYLSQIWFENYGPAKKINWAEDDRYWEIVPVGWVSTVPEPSTYGAILGAVGIGLVLRRKRRTHAVANKQLTK